MKIVIPARLASQRFPRKLLEDFDGKPLLYRVWEKAVEAFGLGNVIVAVDDKELEEILPREAWVEMTSKECRNGTERIAEVAKKLAWEPEELVLNLQGDEPLVNVEMLKEFGEFSRVHVKEMGTVVHPIKSYGDFVNPNRVKAICSKKGKALLFTRFPFPVGVADEKTLKELEEVFQHVGIYSYRVATLLKLATLEPSPMEQKERLEQLRALANDIEIQTMLWNGPVFGGVDVPEDLVVLRKYLENKKDEDVDL